MTGALHGIGSLTLEFLETTGRIGRLFALTVGQSFRRPWRTREALAAMAQLGAGSLPIIAFATAFAGLVVAGEIAWHMDRALHTVSMVPGFTGQFILRELGIAVPALLLVAKVGASITAEIGSMKVTEQLDALRLLGVDPVNYLVVPRFLACIAASVCLTLVSVAVTFGCAMAVAVGQYHFSTLEYLNAVRQFVGPRDLACAVAKGCVFGAVIPVVSCALGMECREGAEGVGSATTSSVVLSTLLVIGLDFALTYVFSLIL